MKCPYRPITITTNNSVVGSNTTKTEFAECYYSDCPWYVPEHYDIDTKKQIFEECKRCHTDNMKAKILCKHNNID